MFSPLLKRFVSMDPLGFSAGSMNLYETFGCDPVNHVDPMGYRAYPADYIGPLPNTWDFRAPTSVTQEMIDQWNANEENKLAAWFGSYEIAGLLLKGATEEKVTDLIFRAPPNIAPPGNGLQNNRLINAIELVFGKEVSLIYKGFPQVKLVVPEPKPIIYVLLGSTGSRMGIIYWGSKAYAGSIVQDYRDEGYEVIYYPEVTLWQMRRAFEDSRPRIIVFIGHGSPGGGLHGIVSTHRYLDPDWPPQKMMEYQLHQQPQAWPLGDPVTMWRIGPNLRKLVLYACQTGTEGGIEKWHKAVGIGVEIEAETGNTYPGARFWLEWPWW
jgi:hypothetical protein